MRFSLTTWNINSVRLRFPLVKRFLQKHAPDVLCLQETKCPDDKFPRKDFEKIGYPHVAIYGQKGYHGVATISRHPIGETQRERFCKKEDCRHLGATLRSPTRIERAPFFASREIVWAASSSRNDSLCANFTLMTGSGSSPPAGT
jgi:exodeoxyribonuclease-3